jgi:glycosyltransferase involved in cell wall biosynthesis|tara:strand:+ start:36552 stop:37952 length:1401 start_codon:yes stop_codon:yes gene_type:complete
MLAAHEPTIDPRVMLEYETTKKEFDVTLVGFENWVKKEFVEDKNIIRLPRNRRAGIIIPAKFIFWILKIQPKMLPCLIAYVVLNFFHTFLSLSISLFRLAVIKKNRLIQKVYKGSINSVDENGFNQKARYEENVLKSILKNLEKIEAIQKIGVSYWIGYHIFMYSKECSKYILANFENIDLIHCNDFDTLPIAAFLKEKYRCKLVYDAHEYWPHSLTTDPHKKNNFFQFLERNFISKADAVCTVNPLLAKEIGLVYSLNHVHSILNAEPWSDLSYSFEEKEKLVFLYQGNFAPDRGLEEVIKAWSILNPENAILQLRGPDSPSKEKVINQVNQFNIKNVEFPDAVSEHKLVTEAKKADIGIIPYKPVNINYKLCCPNKLSQYLHAGLVLLVNDLDFVASVVKEGKVGFVYQSDDIESICSAISKIISNKHILNDYKKRSILLAKEKFNWQIEGEKLIKIYEEVLKV